jgi:hypothetical protein
MNKCRKSLSRALVAHYQPTEGLQPPVGALNEPSALISSEFASVLMRRHPVVPARRDDRLNISLDQQGSNFIALLTTVCNQSLGLAALGSAASDATMGKRLLKQFDFRGGSLLHLYSERSNPCHRPVPCALFPCIF